MLLDFIFIISFRSKPISETSYNSVRKNIYHDKLVVFVVKYTRIRITNMGNTSNWGGARKGAGRPRGIKKPYKTMTISVPEPIAAELKELAAQSGKSFSRFIVDSILGQNRESQEK